MYHITAKKNREKGQIKVCCKYCQNKENKAGKPSTYKIHGKRTRSLQETLANFDTI